ncbi:hypothetical protein WDU94_001437 [Cyamophila willieti]
MFSGSCSFFLLLLCWSWDHCMSSPSPSLPLDAPKKTPSSVSAPASFSYRTPCVKLCECGMGKYATFEHQVYIVNCTDTNLTDAKLLENLPLETEVLIFTGNNISELPSNIFGIDDTYTKLQVIDMSNNNIKLIHGKTFHHVDNVERLILNHNDLHINKEEYHPRIFSNFINLRELHLTDTFADNTQDNLASDLHDIFVESDLKKLEKLHLEQNEISIMKDPHLFCALPNLLHLYLGDNYLKGIHFDLECMQKLVYLDLERNRISILMKDDLKELDVVANKTNYFTVEVASNPFLCSCDVLYFYEWLNHTKVEFRHKDTLKCNITQLNCVQTHTLVQSPNDQLCDDAQMFILYLTLLVVLALVIFLYVKRDMFRTCSRPVLDTVSRKVHYTSLSRTGGILEFDL